MEMDLKYQACNLCDALIRNINDSFDSISFEILGTGDIMIKIVLSKLTDREEQYIDDLTAEFEALQQKNCVIKPIVEIGDSRTLENIIYMKDPES